MAKVNYNYEKRSRELEKQKKKEEKRLKKLNLKNEATEDENAQKSSELSSTSEE